MSELKKQILKSINRVGFSEKSNSMFSKSKWENIFTFEMLRAENASKCKSIVQIHHLQVTDEILLLITDGFWSKASFVITEQFISIAADKLFSKPITKIEWKDVSDIQYINSKVVFNLLNGEPISVETESIYFKNQTYANELTNTLSDIHNIVSGKPESWLTVAVGNAKRNKKIKFWGIVVVCFIGIYILSYFIPSPTLDNYITRSKAGITQSENVQVLDSAQESTEDVKSTAQLIPDTIWQDTKAKGFTEITYYIPENVFVEPYNLTLKSAGLLNEGDRAIIPVMIPKNTECFFYTIILSNAKKEARKGGMLVNNIKKSSGEVTIAGFSAIGLNLDISSLSREVLNAIDSPSEEKAYCNIYFIDKKAEAVKFQESHQFVYDIDNSIKNTHSRKEVVRTNGKPNTYYLGLENKGYSDNIYVIVEVVAMVKQIKYYKVIVSKEIEDKVSN